jgi:hypothetical protein
MYAKFILTGILLSNSFSKKLQTVFSLKCFCANFETEFRFCCLERILVLISRVGFDCHYALLGKPLKSSDKQQVARLSQKQNIKL